MVEQTKTNQQVEEEELYAERAFQSMFQNWYPKIRALKRTYKSKIISVSNLFVENYLKADGLS